MHSIESKVNERVGTLQLGLTENRFISDFSDGKFGAMMQVHIQNDGPVTLEIESPMSQRKGSDGGA